MVFVLKFIGPSWFGRQREVICFSVVTSSESPPPHTSETTVFVLLTLPGVGLFLLLQSFAITYVPILMSCWILLVFFRLELRVHMRHLSWTSHIPPRQCFVFVLSEKNECGSIKGKGNDPKEWDRRCFLNITRDSVGEERTWSLLTKVGKLCDYAMEMKLQVKLWKKQISSPLFEVKTKLAHCRHIKIVGEHLRRQCERISKGCFSRER